jgi:hypothetical protein
MGSIYKKLSRPINAINHLPPPQYAKWGWCAAITLRQYLVCRECRKVAQHWCSSLVSESCCSWRGAFSVSHWIRNGGQERVHFQNFVIMPGKEWHTDSGAMWRWLSAPCAILGSPATSQLMNSAVLLTFVECSYAIRSLLVNITR